MEKKKKLVGYYGMKSDLANDLERIFKKNLGCDISYNELLQEVLKKYGFSEKVVLDMLEPYKEEDQYFQDVVDGKIILSVAPEWKMGEKKSLFDGL